MLFRSANGGTKVTDETLVNTASNHSIYAHWISKPIITGGSADWINKEVNIALEVPSTSDTGSVKYQYYVSTSNSSQVGGEWKDTSVDGYAPVSSNGIHYVFYRAISSAGVYSDISNYQTLKIDTDNPTLSVTGNPTSWVTTDVTLKVSASDSTSGLKNVTVNGKALLLTNGVANYTVSANGTYTFVATDVAGNTTTQSVVVSKIDKVTPTAPVLTGGSSTTTETSRTISVKTPGTTGISGLKNYEVMTYNFLTDGRAPFHKVTKDLTISNGTYTTTGTDPYISYHDLGNVAIQTVIVQFSEATTHEMALTVFYMKEGETAQGANSVVTTVPVGTTGFFTVDIPDGTYDALRFDLGNVSGVTYKISAIRYVNYTTRTAANDEYVISNRGVTSAYYRTVSNNGKKSEYTVMSDDTKGYIDNSVAKVGNFRYSTLQKAITLAATNTATTVTLLKNVTESVQVSSAKSITINGQNYEVASGGNKPCITTNGTLTLNNLGLSTVNDSDHGASTLVVNGGSVTINISNNDLTIFSSGGHAIYMTGGTVTLNSGDVFANAANGIKAATLVTGGTLNINGGRISNPTGGNPVGMESSGVVSMKGGTLKSYEENSTCYAAEIGRAHV